MGIELGQCAACMFNYHLFRDEVLAPPKVKLWASWDVARLSAILDDHQVAASFLSVITLFTMELSR